MSFPLKRINVLGKVIVGFGGREGIDSKVMIFLPGSGFHYTAKMLTSPGYLKSKIPVDIHKTWEGPHKRYLPLARGTFNTASIIQTIAPDLKPSVEWVDVASREWRKREVLPLDEILRSTLGSRELNITESWLSRFNPVTLDETNTTDTFVAITDPQDKGGFLVKAGAKGLHFQMPALETIEERMSGALDITALADVEQEFDGLLD